MTDILIKERPILFSGAMARALLAGSKTHTRRILKPQPPANWGGISEVAAMLQHCPYGQPGERLWVRETLSETSCGSYLYAADKEHVLEAAYEHSILRKEKKAIPAIHMPREASRLLLEITSVRVERLQDISEADAVAEGYPRCRTTPQYWYKHLWGEINGPDSWEANPWVWVVEFKVIEPA